MTVGSDTPSAWRSWGCGPVDLFYMLDAGGARDMPGFDDLLIDYAERLRRTGAAARCDLRARVQAGGVCGPDAVRGGAAGARAARCGAGRAARCAPTDFALQNEAATARRHRTRSCAPTRSTRCWRDLQATTAAVDAFIDGRRGGDRRGRRSRGCARCGARHHRRLDRGVSPRPCARWCRSGCRGRESDRAQWRARRARVHRHAVGARRAHRALAGQADRVRRRHDRVRCAAAAATDEERIALLIKAGRIVSTTVIAPLPADSSRTWRRRSPACGTICDAALDGLVALHDNAVIGRGDAHRASRRSCRRSRPSTRRRSRSRPFRDSVLALARRPARRAAVSVGETSSVAWPTPPPR